MDVMSMMGFRDLKQKSAIRNHCDRLATICEISQRKLLLLQRAAAVF